MFEIMGVARYSVLVEPLAMFPFCALQTYVRWLVHPAKAEVEDHAVV